MGISHYPAGDGEDDIQMRGGSYCVTERVREMLRKRCSSVMFEALALLLGAYAVLEG